MTTRFRQSPKTGTAHSRQLPIDPLRKSMVNRVRLIILARASKKQSAGNNSGSSSIPPPPPTVAPPPAAPRQPKIKQSYRRPGKTDEELQQGRAASQQRSAGRTTFLTAEDLDKKHAEVALAQKPAPHYTRIATNPAKGQVAYPVVLIDGYNLLYYHESTRQLMEQDKIEVARSYLHVILKQFAAEHSRSEYRVIYDATSVSQSKPYYESRIAERVTVLYKSGQEADSVIMDIIQQQHKAAYKAERAGASLATLQQRTYIVHTNDLRIHEWCNNISTDAARVFCYGQRVLSQQLKRVEDRLGLVPGSGAAAAAAAAITAGAAANNMVHLEQEYYSAAQLLQIKRKLQQQQLQLRQKQRQQVAQRKQRTNLSDQELLERVRAVTPAAAAAGSASGAREATPAASASVTEHLDGLLSLDPDSLLID